MTPARVKVLVNAQMHTMDRRHPWAEALAFSKGRILCVGRERAVLREAGAGAETIDLGGRAVLPGFIDCHTHFLSMGVWRNRLDLSPARSRQEVLDAVRRRAKKAPSGSWILGRGWDESRWKETSFLDRRELDSAAPRNPVLLIRVCGHLAAMNTRGLSLLGGKIGAKGIDRRFGLIREGALERARYHLRPSPGELAAGLESSLGEARRQGVTSVHDIVELPKLRAYESARRAGRLTVRATLHFEDGDRLALLRSGRRPGGDGSLLRIGGMKLYADGSFGARTAALAQPYADAPSLRGRLLLRDRRLEMAIRSAERTGVQLLVHAIGDRAVEQVISAFSCSFGPIGRAGSPGASRLRHRIEHLELVGEEQLARMRQLGLWASMQPNFVGEWGHPGGMMEARLGKSRYRHADPFRKVLRAKVPLVFGSDCMPFSPLYGIHCAVNAPFPDQRLAVGEAVAAYTRTAAAASFEEGFKGTLAPRKAADLVVLSGDPFREPARIRELAVDATMMDGRILQ